MFHSPLRRARPLTQTAAVSTMSAKLTGPDILIIEDDPLVRSFLSEVLLQQWFTVATAADGEAALNHLQEHGLPKLILLDLEMSGMNGWQFRERQQQDPELAKVPVAVISGLDPAQLVLSRMDAVAYLNKPFDIAALLALAERYCRPQDAK